MRKFKIGERARISRNAWASGPHAILGKECTIVAYSNTKCPCHCGRPVYRVEVEHLIITADEGSLRKLLPDSDTYKKSTWDEFHKIINTAKEQEKIV